MLSGRVKKSTEETFESVQRQKVHLQGISALKTAFYKFEILIILKIMQNKKVVDVCC